MKGVPNGKVPRPEDDLSATMQICAGKLTLLNLVPIKKRLGSKWPRLRDLIHKLFERALRNAQGPKDSFMQIEEVAYLATFHGLSREEASLRCASVAKQVCALVFGEQDEDVTLSSVVGPVGGPVFPLTKSAADGILSALSRDGVETVYCGTVSKRPRPATPGLAGNGRHRAGELASAWGYSVGLFPIWDLVKNECNGLQLAMYFKTEGRPVEGVNRTLGQNRESDALELEIALLSSAGEYSLKVQDNNRVCALTVGVGYDTLMSLPSRIRYITALKKLKMVPSCPLLLKIDQVPSGIPVGRLGELLAMLKIPGMRTVVEFENARTIPHLDPTIAAVGIAGVVPQFSTPQKSKACAEMLVRRTRDRGFFTVLAGLDHASLVNTARDCGVRFGLGKGLSDAPLTDLESVPPFPLIRSHEGKLHYLPC